MLNTARPLVLIIEDDLAVATLIHEVLADCGYQTLVAGDASAALEQLDGQLPAVMTLDLSLPGVSGVSLLQLIRRQWPAATLPVVVITAHPYLDPAVYHEAQAIIMKPFDPASLQATVAACLTKSHPLLERAAEA
jgi:DNA-binding response OmpR family regulator